MKVICRTCHRTYDDSLRWDHCPHEALLAGEIDSSWPPEYDRLETAVQLVGEAYDVLTVPTSPVNLADWCRSARTLLEGLGRLPKDAA